MICKILKILRREIGSVISSFVLENENGKFVLTFTKHDFDIMKKFKEGDLVDLNNKRKTVFSSYNGDIIVMARQNNIVENQDSTQQTNGDADAK